MSYAEAAKKGPKQSPEEVSLTLMIRSYDSIDESRRDRAPAPPTMDSSTSSYDNVDRDAQHVKSEAKDTANQAADKTKETADKAQGKSSDYAETAKQKAKEASDYTKEKSSEFADSAERNYGKAKDSASKNAKEAKKEIKSAGQDLDENKDNPVYIANGVLLVAGSAALGYGAYTKHQAGQLDWQLAGVWAAAVGVLAVGDYFVSQYLLQNKYPKK
ncbi:hypothetical protein P7C71_g781, partial [Lecanoromycetidae sp. Uapishka_2]